MNPVELRLIDQRQRVVVDEDLNPLGWTPLDRLHGGVMAHDVGLSYENSCPGAGELFLDRMEITFDGPVTGVLPCANWTARGNVLVIGAGGEYLAPRSSLVVRWDYTATAPTEVPYGSATVRWHPSQKRDVFGPLKAYLEKPRPTGMVPVYGGEQVAPPGAHDRDGVPGHEQDGPGFLLRSDLVINRMPIGCVDQRTGEPLLLNDPDYTLVRGWSKATQLAEFSRAFARYQESRDPIVTLKGASRSRELLLGTRRDKCASAFDGQHLGNALGHLRAAAQCGDPIAIRHLALIANDCAMARQDPSSMVRGGRDMAWRIDAWAHARQHWFRAESFADDLVARQTGSGAFLRAPKDYPFSPTPQSFGMPPDFDTDATMERWLTCYALGLFGHTEPIRKAISGCPWPVPKFLGVGRNQTEKFPTYQHPCGPGDYFPDLALGVLATLDPASTDWQYRALTQPTPDGVLCDSLRKRRDVMRAATLGREQSAVLLSVLEQVLA
jgi:hypothetical protein